MTWSIHLVLAFILSVRVIMKRPSTGIALAWLLVINAIPIFGEVIYLLIGERRISWSRREGIKQLRSDYSEVIEQAVHTGLLTVDWEKHGELAKSM
ncbi:PLDc N-terminal domain-containing protein, partial [Rubripirellula sp.]|nr:PLDc N-terminal domain-containing protein [Rubripirellula sp.]